MAGEDNSLTSLKDILSDLFSSGTVPFNPDDMRVWEIWAEAVGPAIARHAQPEWIKNGQLRVIVSEPIWLQELTFVKEEIRTKINEKLGRPAVDKIDFRLGSL